MGSDPCTPPELLPDTAHSKVVMGIRGFVLGLIFLELGRGFYLRKKVSGGPRELNSLYHYNPVPRVGHTPGTGGLRCGSSCGSMAFWLSDCI